jgi:hypothetical protein
MTPHPAEVQLTSAPHGHILTNINVWSPDGRWIVYDTRSDAAGAAFDGTRIERVNVETREVQVLYESRNGAHCGVATCSPVDGRVAFILGPEHPTPDWTYAASRRQGVIVDPARPGVTRNLDARDLTPPFTPGALRGGTHVHVFSGDGQWVSFTYEDDVLARLDRPSPDHDVNRRNLGVSVLGLGPVSPSRGHPRNHDGEGFSVLVTRTTANPTPGSDEIGRAFEDAWVGTRGYIRADGGWQRRAIAFQGEVVTADGRAISEVFIVDIPDDVTVPGEGPLQGTEIRMPAPPRGTVQRRLTRTADRKYPGIQGPRHWLRSSPDGSQIAFLMKDDAGTVQLWTVPPTGGEPRQVTRYGSRIDSAFSWSPDGRWIAHVMDDIVCMTDVANGCTARLTPRASDATAPRPEACVFSPDGRRIAYVLRVPGGGAEYNQICVVTRACSPC